jgi:hypothetical protein
MKFKGKDQMNVLLSHFLNNGLRVISTQLGINRSEVMRMALYNLLKETYTKQEMDWFAGRDDIVDEWIEHLQTPGHTDKFNSKILISENEKDKIDEYNELFNNELDKKLKPIKKKYAIPYAEDFLRNTGMTEKEASEFFKMDFKQRQQKALEYMKEVKTYLDKEYPKELKEIEANLEKITGLSKQEIQQKQIEKHISDMIQYYKEGIEAYKDQPEKLTFEKEQLKHYQEMKKDMEKLKKNDKEKSK